MNIHLLLLLLLQVILLFYTNKMSTPVFPRLFFAINSEKSFFLPWHYQNAAKVSVPLILAYITSVSCNFIILSEFSVPCPTPSFMKLPQGWSLITSLFSSNHVNNEEFGLFTAEIRRKTCLSRNYSYFLPFSCITHVCFVPMNSPKSYIFTRVRTTQGGS